MLVLCRKVIAKLLKEMIEKRTDATVFAEYDYKSVSSIASIRKPTLALIEIPERYDSPALDVLDVCVDIKAASPGCKIMLMCPERDKESVAVCEEAVKSGKVEDYVFFETSPEYLTSKLKTMLPA